MEALRKAEEAKRQAAQKDSAESQAAASEAPVTPDPSMEAASTADSSLPELEFPELALDMPGAAPVATPSLDIPFDFQIDPDLHVEPEAGAVANNPLSVQEPAIAEEPELDIAALDMSAPAPDTPEESPVQPVSATGRSASALSMVDLSLEPELDYVSPHTLRQLSTSAEQEKSASGGLSLEVPEENSAQERQAFIADPEPVPTPQLPGEVVESSAMAEDEQDAEPAARVSKVAAHAAAAAAAAVDERPRVRVETLRATEENRIRESARAVFNAKTGAKGGKWPRSRVMAIVAVVVLLPLGGGAYLYLQQMLTPSVQFNVSPEAIEAARQASLAQETQSEPADVTLPLSEPADAAAVSLATVEDPVNNAEAISDEVDANSDSAVAAATAESLADSASAAIDAGQGGQAAAAPLEEEDATLTASVQTPESAPTPAQPDPEQTQTPDSALVVADTATLPATTPTPTAAPINIIRNDNAPTVNAQLSSAYAAFQDQDYFAARSLYQQALRELPNNRDALLGLAAVSVQLGDVSTARELYSRLLQLDPRDVLARVGLLDSMPLGDSVQTETQLLSLKSEHPEIAQLSFALGNFYAGQRRWNEAQAAYYDALLAAKAQSGSAVSPDFAFNLAVSLDRLNQPEPAYNFYREALEQSRTINPGFDLRILRDRLDSLERQLP